MKIWTDKQGNKLTFKEFIERWKKGIEGITPLQQVKGQINSTIIMLIGIKAGIIVSLFGVAKLWWLLIILIGAFFNTSISLLGLWQKKKLLEKFDVNYNDVEEKMKGGKEKDEQKRADS